jgi:hypothetical protein
MTDIVVKGTRCQNSFPWVHSVYSKIVEFKHDFKFVNLNKLHKLHKNGLLLSLMEHKNCTAFLTWGRLYRWDNLHIKHVSEPGIQMSLCNGSYYEYCLHCNGHSHPCLFKIFIRDTCIQGTVLQRIWSRHFFCCLFN